MATSPTWVQQAYAIANSVYEQATGRTDVVATDSNSFVDLGNSVLSSNDTTEGFMNTLLARMARTYFTYRGYTSDLRDLMADSITWGAIMQKIDAEVPDFVQDETFELEDGESVDMYVVRKPTATQKLFIKRTSFSNFVTISRKLLRSAFADEGAFNNFVGMVFGKMRIRIDLTMETLARVAIANAMVNAGESQCFNLVTMYNAETGETLTADTCLHDKDFMAYAVSVMQLQSKRMARPSVSYNAEGAERHTPLAEQKFLVYDEFQSRLETVVQYSAFHKDLVELKSYIEVPYWQGESDRQKVIVTNSSGVSTTIENIVGAIFDRFALGTFCSEEDTLTTPVNARGRYYNTFYFLEALFYNDMSENFVYFTLN